MKFRSIFPASPALLLFAASMSAHALSAHTWVSSTGNDANAGTATSPYADFATAVANTSAGGIVSVVGPGDYGAVTIGQSITIDGTGGGSITFSGSEGIYIYAPATATVILRNLTVNGEGVGSDAIFFEQGLNMVVDGCKLEGFTQIGVGVGSTSAENVIIRNTVIIGGQLGVRTFQSSGLVSYDHVSLQNVTVQGASSAGVFTRNGSLEILDSVITENNVGVEADTSTVLNVSNSAIYVNTVAVCSYSTSSIRLNNDDIYGNVTGISNCGGTVASSGNNRVMGNPTNTPPNASITLE